VRAAVALLMLSAATWGISPSTSAAFNASTTNPGNTLAAAATFPLCYKDAVTADSPVSYWRLDETSGTSAADGSGSRTGTYTNGVTLGQSGGLPDTINDKAASFDGTNDYVTVPFAAALNPASVTVEAWAKVTGSLGDGSWNTLAGSWWNPSDWRGYVIGVSYDDKWYVATGNGTSSTVVYGSPVTLNSWTHIVGTYSAGTANLYVNGTLVATATSMPYSAITSTVPFIIGAEYGPGTPQTFFPGVIDEVAVYNTALTATKVRTHYNTGRCYKDEVLTDNPKGYWRLGESSGTSANEGMRGDHGTYTNGPTLAATGALTGDSNTAVTFDGTNDYVSVPYDSVLNPSSVTLEGWAKPSGGTGTARTIAATQDTNTGYLLGIGTDNKWRFTVGTGSATTVVTSTATVTLNSWAHVVGTYDGTTATLYVDGLSVGSSATGRTVNSTRPLGIGATDAGGSWGGYFPGSLDEIAVYAAALSSTRVQAHYLMGRSYQDTVLDAGPLSYWRVGESSGTSATDLAGGRTGTYTNTPSLAQVGALAGDSDTSVKFDGSSEYVTKSYVAALNPSQFSVEAWIMPTSGGAYHGIISSWSSGAVEKGYWLGLFSDDTWHWQWGPGSGNLVYYEVTAPAAIGVWTHVVGTYDGTTGRIYVNGALVAGLTAAYSANTTSPFVIGADNLSGSYGNYFPGLVDDLSVYSRALSATEVKLHYDSGRQ
jgi:Concanavalin A-like lectin/glucanases superfamily